MNPQRDNVKAGIFVLVGIALAVAVIIILSDFSGMFTRRQQVRIYYALGDGLQGLKNGARVTLGGQPVGEVVMIEDYAPAGGDGRIIGAIITTSLPARIKLYWNARIELEKPPLGSNTTMNIASVGAGRVYNADEKILFADLVEHYSHLSPRTDDNEMVRQQRLDEANRQLAILPPGVIPGRIAGSALTEGFARDIGIEERQRIQIQEIIDNTRVMTADIRNLTAALGTRGGTIAETIDNIREVTSVLRKDFPEMSASAKGTLNKVGTVVDDAKLAMEDLRTAAKDAKEVVAEARKRSDVWLASIDSITKNADDAVATLRMLIKEKDPAVREAIDNINAITKTAKDQTMKQVEVALDKGTTAIENLRVATEEVKALVIGQRPVLERAFANAGLTTAQLKLAAIEVRRSPWRLLYSPGDEELETDNLYDAARSFALAASTLDSAAQGLRAVAEKEPQNKEQVKRMLDDLEKLFGKYKEAEDEFWKALKEKPASK